MLCDFGGCEKTPSEIKEIKQAFSEFLAAKQR
ncbi:hypothetical protein BH10PLA2_BH10PLA2_11250 [soil metagenome]